MKTNQGYFKFKQGLKRLIDISVSAAGLLILSPILAFIAIVIMLDSPGKPIFSHWRIGRYGRPFKLFKFRSMVAGCDEKEHLAHLERLIENDISKRDGRPYRKRDNDPRVTRVGSILRKYYLDELPQLWNVIRGEMSLVGPRPHVQMEVEHYSLAQRRRLSVKPGLTGLWQATGKADCTFSELIQLDLDYIDYWSPKLDIKIIYYTAKTILRGGEDYWARRLKVLPENYPIKHNLGAYEIIFSDSTKQTEKDWTLVK